MSISKKFKLLKEPCIISVNISTWKLSLPWSNKKSFETSSDEKQEQWVLDWLRPFSRFHHTVTSLLRLKCFELFYNFNILAFLLKLYSDMEKVVILPRTHFVNNWNVRKKILPSSAKPQLQLQLAGWVSLNFRAWHSSAPACCHNLNSTPTSTEPSTWVGFDTNIGLHHRISCGCAA